MGVSKIPYSEIGKSSIVLLAVIHMLTYYLSNYHNNLKYRGYLQEFVATFKYSLLFVLIATFISFFCRRLVFLYLAEVSSFLLF